MIDRLGAGAPFVAFIGLCAALYLAAACSSQEPVVEEAPVSGPSPAAQPADAPASASNVPDGKPELLSEWNQLRVADGELRLNDDVVPYALNSALFSDYSHKLRTISLPPNTGFAYEYNEDVFDFPVGTVITKTFYYPVEADGQNSGRVLKTADPGGDLVTPLDLAELRLIETRVLVHRADGWEALPYVWNDEQTEATLKRTGDLLRLTLVDGGTETDFPYLVPDANQCASCHATDHTDGAILPIGPKPRHVNRTVDYGDGATDQILHWERALGWFSNDPLGSEGHPQAVDWTDTEWPLDSRARAYLDINCSHCHNSSGAADTSGLFLEPWTELGLEVGVCKAPIAAGTGTGGRLVGIDPGSPDDSIFMFRLESTDPASMMPELGRGLVHQEGVDLIADWIESLDGSC